MSRFLALTAIAAALLGIGWVNVHWVETPLDLSPIVSGKTPRLDDPAGLADAADPAGGPAIEITESLLRPLFHADRRPFKPPPVEVAAPVEEAAPPAPVEEAPRPETIPQFRLAGISLSGTRKRALLGALDGTDVRWYAQGESVDGWTVASIASDMVTLASAEKKLTVHLYEPSAAGGIAP